MRSYELSFITRRFNDGHHSREASILIVCVRCRRFDEMLKAAAESNVSLKANPYESDSLHCPFNTRHGCSIFQYYAKNPEKSGRFAKAMAGYQRSKHLLSPVLLVFLYLRSGITDWKTEVESSINELRDHFPWTQLKGTVVDIGGGSGHVSMILARVSYLRTPLERRVTMRGLFLMVLPSKAFP